MKYIDEVDIKNKKVILRVDFNVPIENGKVVDSTRIEKSLKTINYLLDNNCSVILLSHLGRVKTNDDKAGASLFPVAKVLSNLLDRNVKFVVSPVGIDVLNVCSHLQNGEVALLENTRFCDVPEMLESKNDEGLAKYWSVLGDVFVCDAFGSLHRAHASVAGISKFLPTYYGFLVKEEMEGLKPVVENIKRPFGVFMGGAKIDDKLKYIKDILPKCDFLLVGGGIANSFLYARGYDVGDSICTSDEITIEELKKLLETYKGKIVLPRDFVIDDNKILDLGEKSINKYTEYLSRCETIFINGTCGKFEEEKYAKGTLKLISNLKNNSAIKIAGGGDTLNFINKYELNDIFDYLSSGGGASIEYVSSGHLSAIDYIENNNK